MWIFFPKIISLQCSWVKGLYDNNFLVWKVIPLFLIKNYQEKNFCFALIVKKITKILPGSFNKVGKIFILYLKKYNEYMKIDNNTIYYCCFSHKDLNYIVDLFEK